MAAPRPQPPLSQPLSAHPLYPELLESALSGRNRLLDVGSGLGKDLLELIAKGVDPRQIVAVDSDPQIRIAAIRLFQARFSASAPYRYLIADIRGQDDGAATYGPYGAIVCYKLLHLLPPDQHKPLLLRMISLLAKPTRSLSSLIVGLQRAYPADHPSGWASISSTPLSGDHEQNYLYNSLDFQELLGKAVRVRVEEGRLNYGSKYLEGPGEGRGACRWWVRWEADV